MRRFLTHGPVRRFVRDNTEAVNMFALQSLYKSHGLVVHQPRSLAPALAQHGPASLIEFAARSHFSIRSAHAKSVAKAVTSDE
jgi:hypothetical protein